MPKQLDILKNKIEKKLKGKTNPRTKEQYTNSDILEITIEQLNKKTEWSIPGKVIETYNTFTVSEEVDNPTHKTNYLDIQGIAINAGVTRNNVNYKEEELQVASKSLIGVPIMKNHSSKVEDIVGRVTASAYDEGNKRITYAGRIMDMQSIQMIKDGRINQVSVRTKYNNMVEDEDNEGVVIVEGLEFLELSEVAIAGDPKATLDFNSVVREDYDKKIKKECDIMADKVEAQEDLKTRLEALEAKNKELATKIEELEKPEEVIEEPKKEEEVVEKPVEEVVEPKDEEKEEMVKKIKELEEQVIQGKGKVVASEDVNETSEYVKKFVPGEGMTMYKRGAL